MLRGGGWLRSDVYAACSVCVVGLSQGDVDSFQDDPQYKGMKYLVFGTILSSLLSELQIIIPKTDRNGVCIGMLNPMLQLRATAERIGPVMSVVMSVRFPLFCRLPLRVAWAAGIYH